MHAEQKNNTADNSDVKNSSRYSYNELINKPDMEITVIDDSTEYTTNATTRKGIVNKAVENAIKVGYKNANENAVVNVKDIDNDVIISKSALRHGLDRRLSILAPITLNVGDILQNSIRINEMLPKNPNVEKTYVLIGAAKNQNNEPYIVSFVVNRSTNELTYVDVLYSINTKTEPAGSLSPDVPTKVDYLTGSTISISDLLDYVNKYYPDILPEDVLKHYNYDSRPDGKLGESVLYQSRIADIDNEYLEAVNNNDIETAQKLVDEAAKENGYTIKAYHGTTNQQGKSTWNDKMKWYDTEYKHFTVFKRQYDEQAGHFFNDDIDNAGGYGSILYSVYLKINKPLVIDCKGQNYASITFDGKEMDTYEWAEYAKNHRYDGVIFKNISDGVGYDDLSRLTTDYVVFNSNQIKSSEPITYDDKGNVIPLSKRFINYSVDIRYQSRNTEPDYNFFNALNKKEWGSFYASVKESNQRDNLRIGDYGILIPDEDESKNYKLVYYNGNSATPRVKAVYKLENYEYTIHEEQLDFETILDELRWYDKNDEHAKTILENNTRLYGTVFKEYSGKSWVVISEPRESVPNRENAEIKPDGTGTSENVEQGVSDSGVNDNIEYQQRYVEPASTALEERLQGDELLDAQDIIDTIKSVGGKVDEYGNAILYHGTNKKSRDSIYQSGKMTAKEDGLFFSTKPDGEIKGYGDNIVRVKIPVEYLELNDVFNDEAHFRLPLNSDYSANVSSVLFQMRPDNGFANRRLLANALEKSAQNNYEKNKVKLYKENIDQIDELEARLEEVNEKIKKATSVKAAERTREQRTKLMKLNNVKKILQDKIIRKDKQLLNFESMEPMKKLIESEKKKAYDKARLDYKVKLKESQEKRPFQKQKHQVQKQR